MPKAQSDIPGRSSGQAPFQAAHVLKRNQACHQCRRRKLKCDAKRPCSTCVRSHSYAVAHAPAGVELPPHPECTFDELPDTPPSEPVETPKNRFERLESRINELETLLREKDRALNTLAAEGSEKSTPSMTSSIPNSLDNVALMPQYISDPPFTASQLTGVYSSINSAKGIETNLPMEFNPYSGGSLENLAGLANMASSSSIVELQMNQSPQLANNIQTPSLGPTYPSKTSQDLLFLSWPSNLPEPEVTRHLAEAFFAFHLHAVRLFHGPSFLASLSLHPTDPRFPSTAILHCICAIGSMYTATIPPTPHLPDYPTHELFGSRLRRLDRRPDSFAEQQAKFAKKALEFNIDFGQETFQCLQVSIMLTWFYWSQGRWSEAFLSASQALRIAVPCGLNACPPFHTIADTLRPPAIIPPAKTVIEDEMRRNAFWLAYAMERQMGSGNGWALSLDDQDVCQLLPLRGDQYEQGLLVYPSDRQWSHDKDMLITHPEGQIDSFILYIKANILSSRVKNFNLRFKGKHYSGDASMISPNNSPASGDTPEYFDVKDAPAFRELDKAIGEFKASFPPQYRNPVDNQAIDQYLFTAHLVPNLAQILLHESHARPGAPGCLHADKILRAAREIVNIVYAIGSTSYDITLLGLHAIMCWFMAARVLVRFLKAAIDSQVEEQITQLQAEISFIRSMIIKAAGRFFLADRYKKMLDDYLITTCGQQFLDPTPINCFGIMGNHQYPHNSNATVDMYLQYKAPPMPPAPSSQTQRPVS
ncbi:hypothetical protein C8Q75DRAFT_241835 [Abortiporus biennis]|nr:hypothetical protein C8Q75DRAFT_241835 [Abortiporus biennis]